MQDIVVGRGKSDLQKWGLKGTVLLGRHYIAMGHTQSLSNNIYLDVSGAHVVFICGKRGGGKCLTGDTLVSLADGREVPISSLEREDVPVLGLNTDLKIAKLEKDEFFKRSVKKILHLRLRSGKELKLTPEHPLLTVSGWVPAQSLAAGSRIAASRKTLIFGEKDLSEEKVKLLAYLIAEGHLSNGFVLFSNTDDSIIQDFCSAVKAFDANLEIKTHSNECCFRVVNTSTKDTVRAIRRTEGTFTSQTKHDKKSSLRVYVESLGMYGKLAPQREIPDCIFQLPQHKLALFLNRLFSCDGSIYSEKNSRWRISYASASKVLIQQVQSLLLRFEILSNFRKKLVNEKISYELELFAEHNNAFLQQIGFFGQKQRRQQIALLECKTPNPNLDTVPKEIWDSYRPSNWIAPGKALNYSSPKALRSSINYSPSRQKLLTVAVADNNEYIQKLASADIFWDEIVAVEEKIGSFDVYDISVPEFHNFVANGVIVHNSYTMGVIVEGFHLLDSDVRQNLSVILLDTMGIYWTMKYPNHQDKELLDEWGLKPESIPIKIFTPEKYYHEYKEKGIPTDVPFTLAPAAIDPDDWCNAFRVDKYSSEGVTISKTILALKKSGKNFLVTDIIEELKKDDEATVAVKDAVIAMFRMADTWGVFSDHGTPLSELAKGGQISVLDVSCYATMPGGWDVKALMVGLVAQRLFIERMLARKDEEFEQVNSAVNYFSTEAPLSQDMPLVWLVIDEAHEFLPRKGKVASTDALVTVMREGRQPGISLVLATQQPGKIHTDVMTQSDTVLSHRITAKIDVDALGALMQSYMREGLVEQLDQLPRVKGAGILFDDNNEKMYPMRIRPRFTWHGGSSPNAIPVVKETDDNQFL